MNVWQKLKYLLPSYRRSEERDMQEELESLAADFGLVKPVTNWRKIVVGEARPAFTLQRTGLAA